MQGYSGNLHSRQALEREVENCQTRLTGNITDRERGELELRLRTAKAALATL